MESLDADMKMQTTVNFTINNRSKRKKFTSIYTKIMNHHDRSSKKMPVLYKKLPLSSYGVKAKKPIGKGGFGKVYVYKSGKKKFAIKDTNCRGDGVDPAQIRDAFGVPNLVWKLPCIATCRDLHHAKSDYQIVQPFYQQGNLHHYLRDNKLSMEQKNRVAIEMCHAVASLHNYNVLHLDIKPANFFVDSTGKVKLGDFGLVQPFCFIDIQRQAPISTPAYRAPEAMVQTQCDALDDWSLGATLFYLYTETVLLSFPDLKYPKRKVNRDQTLSMMIARYIKLYGFNLFANMYIELEEDPSYIIPMGEGLNDEEEKKLREEYKKYKESGSYLMENLMPLVVKAEKLFKINLLREKGCYNNRMRRLSRPIRNLIMKLTHFKGGERMTAEEALDILQRKTEFRLGLKSRADIINDNDKKVPDIAYQPFFKYVYQYIKNHSPDPYLTFEICHYMIHFGLKYKIVDSYRDLVFLSAFVACKLNHNSKGNYQSPDYKTLPIKDIKIAKIAELEVKLLNSFDWNWVPITFYVSHYFDGSVPPSYEGVFESLFTRAGEYRSKIAKDLVTAQLQ